MSPNESARTFHPSPHLAVQARFDREALGSADPEAHLIARVRATRTVRSVEAPPMALAIVLDASGSMGGAKLENAKRAALLLARRLRPCDQLAVVSFADDVVVHVAPRPMTAEQQAQAEAEVRSLHTRGCTDLAAGWLTGASLLQPLAAPGRRAHVILLSDGMANRGLCDPIALGERAGALRQAGVTTTCVGVGADYSTVQLAPIAEHGGGRFHHADEAHEIERLLLGELAELGAVAVRDARIVVSAAPGLVVEPVSDLVAAGPAGAPGAYSLGDLVDGAERLVVFRVRPLDVAARSAPWHALVNVVGQSPDGGVASVAGEVVCVLPHADAPHVAPRAEDAEIVAQAWSARVLRRAADLNERREYQRVRALLRDEAERMRRYAVGIPAVERVVESACAKAESLTEDVEPVLRKGLFVMNLKHSRGERELRRTE